MRYRSSDDPGIGGRIRDRRKLAGLSIRHAASIAAISHTTWSRIERGDIGADNRFTLSKIAEALRCPVAELIGVELGPADAEAAARHAAVYGAVRAMLDADLAFPAHAPARPVPALTESVDLVYALRTRCDYVGAANVIAELAPALHATAVEGERADREQAMRMLVLVADAASFTARYSGESPASALIAERGRQVAAELGDPVMSGLAAYTGAHAALACGLYPRGLIIAQRAADAVRPHMSAAGAPEVYGQLLLTAAFSLYGQGDRDGAADLVAEAEHIAAGTGETKTLNLHFGPTNIRFWRISMAADGGDPAEAVALARETNPQLVDAISRQVAFYVDTGRALAHSRRPREALRMLVTAERMAPQRVRNDRLAVETARHLLDSAQRDASGSELRGLCERMGVAL